MSLKKTVRRTADVSFRISLTEYRNNPDQVYHAYVRNVNRRYSLYPPFTRSLTCRAFPNRFLPSENTGAQGPRKPRIRNQTPENRTEQMLTRAGRERNREGERERELSSSYSDADKKETAGEKVEKTKRAIHAEYKKRGARALARELERAPDKKRRARARMCRYSIR